MPPRKRARPASPPSPDPAAEAPRSFTRPSAATYYSYRIGRGEQLVLTFEPYKSHLLPHWRFRTVDIAQESSERLWHEFRQFAIARDFVGMDMTRKFLQMGMTRAARYANRKGGKKYSPDTGEVLPKSTDHEGATEKARASAVFRAVWERAKLDPEYLELRNEWEADKKDWVKRHPDEVVELAMTKKEDRVKKEPNDEQVDDDDDDDDDKASRPKRRKQDVR